MNIGFLSALLQKKDYAACRSAALELMQQPDLPLGERAVVAHALCASSLALQRSDEAVGHGEVAVYLCRWSGDYDLLGRALVNSACALVEVGLHRRASERFREYFQYLARYQEAGQWQGQVRFNLAVAYRNLGEHEEALDQFEQAWAWARQHQPDTPPAQRWRSNLVWQHILLGRLDEADALVAAGDDYLQRHPGDLPTLLLHRNDQALLAYRRGDLALACERATEVLERDDQAPEAKARAAMTLHKLALDLKLNREALTLSLLAKQQAYHARRLDMIEQVNLSIQEMRQQDVVPALTELLQTLQDLPQRLRAGNRAQTDAGG